MANNKKVRIPIIRIIFIALFAALDQYTKYLAVLKLKDKPAIVLIDGVLELNYLENRGAAFGIMQNQKVFFVFMALVILLAIIYVMAIMPRQKRYLPLNVLLVFVAAGAVGNMIDRVRLEYVVDFIFFVLINFPIFNVADIYVTCSMFALIILILFVYKEDELYFLGFNSHKYRK